jgi:hypothetical protein
MKVSIELFVVNTDCGDGSHSVTMYKNEEAAKIAIAENHDVEVDEVDFDDDPYRWGYPDTATIDFELIDGKLEMIGDEIYLGNFG